MYLDFRPLLRRTFAELSRKYPYPAISRGRIEGKASTRGLGDWLSQSLTFGNLAVAFGACFSRLQKSIIRQWHRQDTAGARMRFRTMVFGCHGSLTFGSSAATYEGQGDCPKAQPHRELNQNQTEILWCPSPAGPRAAVGGSPLQNDYN